MLEKENTLNQEDAILPQRGQLYRAISGIALYRHEGYKISLRLPMKVGWFGGGEVMLFLGYTKDTGKLTDMNIWFLYGSQIYGGWGSFADPKENSLWERVGRQINEHETRKNLVR